METITESTLSPEQNQRLSALLNQIGKLAKEKRPISLLLFNHHLFSNRVSLLNPGSKNKMEQLLSKIPPSFQDIQQPTLTINDWAIERELRNRLGIPEKPREKYIFEIRDTPLNLPFFQPSWEWRQPRNEGDLTGAGYSKTPLQEFRGVSWCEFFVEDDYATYKYIVITKS